MEMRFTASVSFAIEQVMKLREGSLWVYPVGTTLQFNEWDDEENNHREREVKRQFLERPNWLGGSHWFFQKIVASDIKRDEYSPLPGVPNLHQHVSRTVEFYNVYHNGNKGKLLLARLHLAGMHYRPGEGQSSGSSEEEFLDGWWLRKIGYVPHADVGDKKNLKWIEVENLNL